MWFVFINHFFFKYCIINLVMALESKSLEFENLQAFIYVNTIFRYWHVVETRRTLSVKNNLCLWLLY